MKVLFFHNTLPEYRIGWFQNLANDVDTEFVFTNEQLNQKDYGFEIEYRRTKGLKCTYLSNGLRGFTELCGIMRNVSAYDFVELPPIDSLREAVYSHYIVKQCRKHHVKVGYFWEKWEAPQSKQPLVRRVKNTILRIIPGSIYRHADVIFSVGEKSKAYFLSNGVKEEKIAWIPDVSETPACEYVDIRKKYGIPNGRTLVLYLGRMLPQKGVRYLIRAFSMLDPDVRGNMHLLIAGDGEDLENCKSLAQELNLENVTFAGRVEPSIRGNYFAQCDIFVYPVTYYTGWVDVWGLTLNEAVQHGKIIIATDAVGSAYELIEQGVNGFRVEPENAQALSEALKKSLDCRLCQTAAEKDALLAETFNYERMSRQYIETVVKCCS